MKQIAILAALSSMSTEAVIAMMGPQEEEQICAIEGCGRSAVYHVVKLANDATEQEKFFCQDHGVEYAMRGHLAISHTI